MSPTVPSDRRLANVVGALALAVTGHYTTGSDAAALISLLERGDLTIESLRRIVGLTHSAGVRLVDRLVADGLVRRRAGPDRRSVSISLTSRGRRTAATLRGHREARLIRLLEPLDANERSTLSAIAEKLAVRVVTGRLEARFICRLCDHGVCNAAGGCPVDLAATSQGE